jgi:hypothetical protein
VVNVSNNRKVTFEADIRSHARGTIHVALSFVKSKEQHAQHFFGLGAAIHSHLHTMTPGTASSRVNERTTCRPSSA